jgi:two-component system, cell cycle response regulator
MDPTALEDLQIRAAITLHSPDATLLVNREGRIVWASPQIEALLGYRPVDVMGRVVEDLVPWGRREAHERLRQAEVALDDRAMGAGRYLEALAIDGSIKPFDIHLTRFDDELVLVVLRDATERKRLEDGLRHLADSDPLTGLANRRHVLAFVEAALARTRRRGDWMGLCYLDLDRFKPINDLYGHEAGDQVLLAVSRAIVRSVREGDLVGRVGGDEFVIVLEDLGTDAHDAEQRAVDTATRALRELTRPVYYAGLLFDPAASASAGVAVSQGAGDGDDLMRAADAALYRAKAGAPGSVILADLPA